MQCGRDMSTNDVNIFDMVESNFVTVHRESPVKSSHKKSGVKLIVLEQTLVTVIVFTLSHTTLRGS